MKEWRRFLPGSDDIDALGTIGNGGYFIDSNTNPQWESVYFRTDAAWIVLTWNYFDIEFKFETYGISVESVKRAPTTLVEVGSIGQFEAVDFCTKTEWTRPAVPGEVPSCYEQVIEAAGNLAQVPADAISAGTSLYAVVFRSTEGTSDMMISIDDDVRFSLKATAGSQKIAAVLESCDVFDSEELLRWEPPV